MIRFHLSIAALVVAVPAFAGPCVALDYQEMKDMSAEDLTKEACNARWALQQNFDDGLDNMDARRGRPAALPNAGDNYDQCMGQSDRIERVLESKGVSKASLAKICSARLKEKRAAIDRLLGKTR